MSIFRMSVGISAILESIQKRFLWSKAEVKDRIHLVSWNKVYTLKWVGGLNLRRILAFNVALRAKLG